MGQFAALINVSAARGYFGDVSSASQAFTLPQMGRARPRNTIENWKLDKFLKIGATFFNNSFSVLARLQFIQPLSSLVYNVQR